MKNERTFWNSFFDLNSKTKFENFDFTFLKLILNQNRLKRKSVHRKCHSIFILKLECKRQFLCIEFRFKIENWKKKIFFPIFNFQFLFENWKAKFSVFVFQISFYFKLLNYHWKNCCSIETLIKLTLSWVNSFTILKVIYFLRPEAIARISFRQKVFIWISQNSHENTCVGVSFK